MPAQLLRAGRHLLRSAPEQTCSCACCPSPAAGAAAARWSLKVVAATVGIPDASLAASKLSGRVVEAGSLPVAQESSSVGDWSREAALQQQVETVSVLQAMSLCSQAGWRPWHARDVSAAVHM